jgi:hypothetical protein
MTCFPAGDDPIPATVFGTRSKPLGALGLLIRGMGMTFICRARAKLRAWLLAAMSRRRWPLPVLASWRPG